MSVIIRRAETTPWTRSRVIGYSRAPTNYSIRKISQVLFIPKSTVHEIIKRGAEREWTNLDPTTNYPRSGRPTRYPEEIQALILECVDIDSFLTLQEIVSLLATDYNFKATRTGVENALHDAELFSFVARKKPFVTETQKIKRLEWCLERQNWTLEQWRRMIWTDESSFEFGSGGRQRRVWRKKGKTEAYKSKYLQPTFKSRRTSVQIWGCFCYDRKGPIHFIESGRIDAPKYILEVLEPRLIPFWMETNELLGEADVMEDNSPVHTAKMSKQYRAAHGMISIDWPPQSPDLNPIENLWRMMKYRIRKNIAGRPRSIEDMKIALQAEWDKLVPSDWDSLIESMPNRIAECIAAGGGSTHY